MNGISRWLAAAAGLALLMGTPTMAEAAVRAKTGVKAKAKHRKPVRRVTRRRAAAVVPVIAPPPIVVETPPVYVPTPVAPADAPAPRYADYRWLDDADAMLNAIGRSPPDVVFADGRDARYAWTLGDGAVVIAEPLNQFDTRWYFFEPDVTVPFLVRDVGASFALDRGRLVALYDNSGTLDDWRPGGREEALAADLAARGRRLWFAAHDPRPLPSREQVGGFWGQFSFGGDVGWRVNRDWQGYRNGHRRDDRYARERQERAARGDRWHPAASMGAGYWSHGSRPGEAAGRPGVESSAQRPGASPRDRPAAAAPARPDRAAPGAVAERPTRTQPPAPSEARAPRSAEPTADRPARRVRPTEEPATAARAVEAAPSPSPAAAPDPAPVERRARSRPDAAPMREPEAAAPREPTPPPQAAPRVEPEPAPPPQVREREPEAAPPPRAREPDPAPPPRAAPAPEPEQAPPPVTQPKEHRREDPEPQ